MLATFFDAVPRPSRLIVVFATGPDTKPTPDGGPWACDYEVPESEDLARCSSNAERIMWQIVERHAPESFRAATAAGWVTSCP